MFNAFRGTMSTLPFHRLWMAGTVAAVLALALWMALTLRIPGAQAAVLAELTASNDGPTELGDSTNFIATITGGSASAYAWDFGDGSSGTGITTSHTYTESGIYTATVVATTMTNSLSATTTVFVGDAVVDVVNNRFSPANVDIPQGGQVVWVLRQGFHSVTADDGSFNQPAGNDWPPFVHTFTDTGTVDYHCTVHANMTGTVTVQSPVAGLTATNDGPKEVNAPVNFTATITGGTSVSYTWDFGDGGVGSGITTTHSYTESGVYTATVVAANATNSLSATTKVFVGDAVVDVVNNRFSPRDVTIPVGGNVVWVLQEGFHSVTADDGSFDQPAGNDWPPFIHPFDSVGITPYHCTVHGASGGVGMSGSVIVTDAGDEFTGMLLPDIRKNLIAARSSQR